MTLANLRKVINTPADVLWVRYSESGWWEMEKLENPSEIQAHFLDAREVTNLTPAVDGFGIIATLADEKGEAVQPEERFYIYDESGTYSFYTLDEAIEFAELHNCEAIEDGDGFDVFYKCSFCGEWFPAQELNDDDECPRCEEAIKSRC